MKKNKRNRKGKWDPEEEENKWPKITHIIQLRFSWKRQSINNHGKNMIKNIGRITT